MLVHQQADAPVAIIETRAVAARVFARPALAEHGDLAVFHQLTEYGDFHAETARHDAAFDLDEGTEQGDRAGIAHDQMPTPAILSASSVS